MKRNYFNSFLNEVLTADEHNPIWCCGFAFMDLTPIQHSKVWDVLNDRGFPHETVHNKLGVFDGIKLPTGLILLK